MTIQRNLSDLPRDDGLAPDKEPRFVGILAETWQEADVAEGDRPKANATARFRHSDAGKCARLLSYKAAGFAATNPIDLSGINNVRLGTMIHDAWQTALMLRYPTAQVEVKVTTLDGDGAGHIDAVIDVDGKRISYELKSCGGYAYKAAIGKARRGQAAEGPKADHLLQAAINGLACDADEIVVGYIAKEAISVNAAAAMPELMRFACEWTFTREQFDPLARDELDRVAGVLRLVDEGTLAARKLPDLPASAEIVDPIKGLWEQHGKDGELLDTGTHWMCGYCSHQSLCAETGSGRLSIESVVAISKRVAA